MEVTRENGCDYGYGKSEYHHSIWYEEIADDILIVKDGHFSGIMMKSSGSSYNKCVTVYNDLYFAAY